MWKDLLACKSAEVKRKSDIFVAERFDLMVQSEESKSNSCRKRSIRLHLPKFCYEAYHSTTNSVKAIRIPGNPTYIPVL